MAQQIKISDDAVSSIIKKVTQHVLDNLNHCINYKNLKSYDEILVDKRAKLLMSSTAYAKMVSLVKYSSLEIGWHGFVDRMDENTFYLKDVVVFPQKVSSIHVDTDAKEYDKWENEFSIDELNSLRFNGHSHVDFSVNPSNIDYQFMFDKTQNFFEPVAGEDFFYIFLILNKHNDIHVDIFDITNNVRYLNEDIDVDILLDDGLSGEEYFNQENKKVTKENEFTKKL